MIFAENPEDQKSKIRKRDPKVPEFWNFSCKYILVTKKIRDTFSTNIDECMFLTDLATFHENGHNCSSKCNQNEIFTPIGPHHGPLNARAI